MIAAPVESFNLLRFIDMDAGHETYHLASGHFCINALLDDLSTLELAEYTGNIAILRLQILLYAF